TAGLLRLSSKASHPGDLNRLTRELSLSRIVVLDTRRPPGLPGPRGLKRLHGPRGAATFVLRWTHRLGRWLIAKPVPSLAANAPGFVAPGPSHRLDANSPIDAEKARLRRRLRSL